MQITWSTVRSVCLIENAARSSDGGQLGRVDSFLPHGWLTRWVGESPPATLTRSQETHKWWAASLGTISKKTNKLKFAYYNLPRGLFTSKYFRPQMHLGWRHYNHKDKKKEGWRRKGRTGAITFFTRATSLGNASSERIGKDFSSNFPERDSVCGNGGFLFCGGG